jgi:7,8-dihydroneopterin aldolase/epimerase/oxygenase
VDKIVIKDLEVEAHIGVTESERAQTQRLLITVEVERDLTEAGRTDEEAATARYDLVAELIRKTVAQRPRKLVESMTHEIAEIILSNQMAPAVTVEVKKFSIQRCQYVSVQMRRTR